MEHVILTLEACDYLQSGNIIIQTSSGKVFFTATPFQTTSIQTGVMAFSNNMYVAVCFSTVSKQHVANDWLLSLWTL